MGLRQDILDSTDSMRAAVLQIIEAPDVLAKRDAVGEVLKQFREHCAGLITDTAIEVGQDVTKLIGSGNHPYQDTSHQPPANDDDDKRRRREGKETDEVDTAEITKAITDGRQVPGLSPQQTAVIRKSAAHDVLLDKAHELRKAHPELTIEQAYAKVFADPANVTASQMALTKAMPTAIGGGIPFISSEEAGSRYIREGTQEAAPVYDPHVKLLALADDYRTRQPRLTREQAYAAVLQDPTNRDLAAAVLGRGQTRIVA